MIGSDGRSECVFVLTSGGHGPGESRKELLRRIASQDVEIERLRRALAAEKRR